MLGRLPDTRVRTEDWCGCEVRSTYRIFLFRAPLLFVPLLQQSHPHSQSFLTYAIFLYAMHTTHTSTSELNEILNGILARSWPSIVPSIRNRPWRQHTSLQSPTSFRRSRVPGVNGRSRTHRHVPRIRHTKEHSTDGEEERTNEWMKKKTKTKRKQKKTNPKW